QFLVRGNGGAAGLRALLIDQGQHLGLGGRLGVGRLRRCRGVRRRGGRRALGGLGGVARTALPGGGLGGPLRGGGRRGRHGGGGAVTLGGGRTGRTAARRIVAALARRGGETAHRRAGLRQGAGADAVVVAAATAVELAVAGDQSGGDRHGSHRHRRGG